MGILLRISSAEREAVVPSDHYISLYRNTWPAPSSFHSTGKSKSAPQLRLCIILILVEVLIILGSLYLAIYLTVVKNDV